MAGARSGALADDFPHVDLLRAGGVETYEALDRYTDDELRGISGIGPKKIEEIRAAGIALNPRAEAELMASGEGVPVRVNRDRYFRHGQSFGRGKVLRVPEHVMTEMDASGVNPPHLVRISEAEYDEARG